MSASSSSSASVWVAVCTCTPCCEYQAGDVLEIAVATTEKECREEIVERKRDALTEAHCLDNACEEAPFEDFTDVQVEEQWDKWVNGLEAWSEPRERAVTGSGGTVSRG